ncbi:protein FAM135A-like isoform X2 [Xenia sp. Carnegie-2017]|uniref:protein FAM135A-like isoform X2 n=1 Tax=Xenia sp. Carnegie-2017 TaxID=2897299 RepID=UPI001F03E227|nr:protein FAM135A-like isoform X2 [Xenia sp. Carnegie-2017]
MGDFQATVEFMVELYKFYNVDLFVRGNYQIRLTLKPPKSNHTIQVELSHGDNRSYTLAPAYVTEDGLTAVSRTFNIYYKDEEVLLKDVFIFRVHLLIDSAKAADCIDKTEFLMTVDVHFTDQKIQGSNYRIIPWATSRTLKFHFSCFNGLHHQIPLLFDYYFFSVLDMIIHANVVSLGLPDWKILKPLKTGWFNKSTVAGRSSAPLFFINIFGNRAQPSYSDVTVRYSAFKTCSITKECFQKASAIHRNLCAILTMAHSQLYNYFEEMMQYVDKKQRITLGEKMDPAELVEGLCEKLEMLESCEEIYDEMCSDFSVLNTQLGFLWLQFRESFKSKDEIRRPMRLQHHRERMMHLSEAFFVQEFPWKSLLNVNDSSFQKHLSMGQCVKSSRYISEIPPVAVECAEVDGDASTTPIFFEDRYVNKIEDDVLEHKSLFNGTRNVEFRSESPLIIDGEGYSGVREAWQDVRSPRRSNELIAKRVVHAAKNDDVLRDKSDIKDENAVYGRYIKDKSIVSSKNDDVLRDKSDIKDKNAVYGRYIKDKSIVSSKNDDVLRDKSDIKDENIVYGRYLKDKSIVSSNSDETSDDRKSINNVQRSMNNCNHNDDAPGNVLRDINKQESPRTSKFRRKPFMGDRESLIDNIELPADKEVTLECKNIDVDVNHGDCSSQEKESKIVSVSNSSENVSKVFANKENDGSVEEMSHCGLTPKVLNGEKEIELITSVENDETPKPINSPLTLKEFAENFLRTNRPNGDVVEKNLGSNGRQDLATDDGIVEDVNSSNTHHEEKTSDKIFLNHKDRCVDPLGERHFSHNNIENFKTDRLSGECKPNHRQNFSRSRSLDNLDSRGHFIVPTSRDSSLRRRGDGNSMSNNRKKRGTVRIHNSVFYNREFNDIFSHHDGQFSSLRIENLEMCNGFEGKMKEMSPSYGETPSLLQKAKLDVVSRLNFRGNIYSDVATKFAVRPYFMNAKPDLSSLPVHFVVCVHGLDGNCGDLRLIRCFLEMALPSTNFEFLMSEANQDTTFMPFEKQTDRLVDEILHYMESYRISPARISFIGHSLGNVIIRSALAHPKMRPYVNLLYTYLSLSGPHLGMVHHTSSIVSTGMWLLQKWKKSDSLLQLSLNDSADMRDTYIYKLSKKKGLEYFTNVLLVSSVQDHYVPFHSSRIELPKSFRGNSLECNVYREMMENLLTPLLNECNRCLVRYSVYHCLPSSTNTFIGRAAHIAMLDSELFIEKLICTSAAKYFQ